MAEALEILFVGPNAVASVCLLVVFVLAAISTLGALDLEIFDCLLYTSPSPRDKRQSRMPSSA